MTADRATVIQAVQVAAEATAGTLGTSFRSLKSVSFDPGIQMSRTGFRPTGARHAALVPPGKEWTQASVRGPVTYGEIIYPLSMVFGSVAPSAVGTTTGGTAYRYVWTPSNNTAIVPLTYSVEQGDGVGQAQRMLFGYMSEIGVQFNRDMIDHSGQLMAQRLTAFSGTLTAGASSVELVPVLPEDVDIFIDTTAAGLGTTQLSRVVSIDWRTSNMHGPIWTLDSRNSSWAAPVNLAPTVEMRVKMEADSNGMSILTDARAASRKFIRVKATGDAAGSTFYTFQIDFAGEISAVSPFSDDQGLYAVEWTFTSTYDPTWAKSQEISVINHVLSY